MALTSTTLIVGASVLVGLPISIVMLNRWKRHSSWWLLAAIIVFVVVGNAVERLTRGASPVF